MFYKKFAAVLLSISFSAIIFLPIHAKAISCDDSNLEGKSNQDLQAISDQCDREIAEQEAILENTQRQSKDLQNGIAVLTASINQSQLEIKQQSAKIQQIGENVIEKSHYIAKLSGRMHDIDVSLGKIMRETYIMDDTSPIEILLSSQDFSGFFMDVSHYQSVDEQLQQLTAELTGVKRTSESEKKDLENKKAQEEKLRFEQESQKAKYENLQKEKQSILKFTKGQESLYEQSIAQKERLKNQINNRLFKTVGGEELTFGEALKVIQPYESTIGVKSALVLAVLTQETSVDGLIGKNLGKCYYNQPASNNDNSVMSHTQVPSFLAILSEIGLNPNTTPVSCPIYSDGAYGGAMGPAQFMPNTWWNVVNQSGYKTRVASVIGSAFPSPFNNKEAFVGTALYLKDAQTICKTAFSKQSDIWACAAAKYYGGLTLKGSKLKSYMYGTYGYGHQVAVRAASFQNDINTLNLQ